MFFPDCDHDECDRSDPGSNKYHVRIEEWIALDACGREKDTRVGEADEATNNDTKKSWVEVTNKIRGNWRSDQPAGKKSRNKL